MIRWRAAEISEFSMKNWILEMATVTFSGSPFIIIRQRRIFDISFYFEQHKGAVFFIINAFQTYYVTRISKVLWKVSWKIEFSKWPPSASSHYFFPLGKKIETWNCIAPFITLHLLLLNLYYWQNVMKALKMSAVSFFLATFLQPLRAVKFSIHFQNACKSTLLYYKL